MRRGGGSAGLMAIFFCGVVMSHYARYNLSEQGRHTTQHVAHTLAHVAELLTFLYFGFTILPMISQSCDVAENQAQPRPFVLSHPPLLSPLSPPLLASLLFLLGCPGG